MEPNIREIIYDLFLIEFVEKLDSKSYLVQKQDLINWARYFSKDYYKSIPHIQYWQGVTITSTEITEGHFINLRSILETNYPYIIKILELGKGKICLCDIDLLTCINEDVLSTINLYFHSITVNEAKILLRECLEVLHQEDNIYPYERSGYICVVSKYTNIYFHLCIFNDEGDMLRNIGPSIFQQAYNSEKEYFSTISGAITGAMKIFPIDPNFPDILNYSQPNIDFSILFPGFSQDIKPGEIISFSNGIMKNENCPRILENKDIPFMCGTVRNDTEYTTIFSNFYINSITSRKKSLNIQEWIKGYKSVQIGISDDKYVAFSNCRSKFNINNDLFRTLCDYWLRAEYSATLLKLLSLGKEGN